MTAFTSGWVAAAFTCIGFGGSIVVATDLVSHFRVGYVVAILPALATYLPQIKPRKWPAALLAFALSLDVAVIAALYVPSRHRPDGGAERPQSGCFSSISGAGIIAIEMCSHSSSPSGPTWCRSRK